MQRLANSQGGVEPKELHSPQQSWECMAGMAWPLKRLRLHISVSCREGTGGLLSPDRTSTSKWMSYRHWGFRLAATLTLTRSDFLQKRGKHHTVRPLSPLLSLVGTTPRPVRSPPHTFRPFIRSSPHEMRSQDPNVSRGLRMVARSYPQSHGLSGTGMICTKNRPRNTSTTPRPRI